MRLKHSMVDLLGFRLRLVRSAFSAVYQRHTFPGCCEREALVELTHLVVSVPELLCTRLARWPVIGANNLHDRSDHPQSTFREQFSSIASIWKTSRYHMFRAPSRDLSYQLAFAICSSTETLPSCYCLGAHYAEDLSNKVLHFDGLAL